MLVYTITHTYSLVGMNTYTLHILPTSIMCSQTDTHTHTHTLVSYAQAMP